MHLKDRIENPLARITYHLELDYTVYTGAKGSPPSDMAAKKRTLNWWASKMQGIIEPASIRRVIIHHA